MTAAQTEVPPRAADILAPIVHLLALGTFLLWSLAIGIAWQVGRTPGLRLVSITDLSLEQARQAAEAYHHATPDEIELSHRHRR